MLIIKEIKIEDLTDWNRLIEKSSTATFFQTKEWLELWCKHFSGENEEGGEFEGYGVYEGDELIGIVPLIRIKNQLELLGISEVLGGERISDFGDAIIVRGKEKEVWEAVLDRIKNQESGIRNIKYNFIRENSPSFGILKDLGGQAEEVDVAPYIELPGSWDEYLLSLDRHNRHELKRKLRKLEETKAFKICHEGNPGDIDELLRLMKLSSEKKITFLSFEMEGFFRDMITSLWKLQRLDLCFLKMEEINIAAVLLFKFNNEVLLYNSGYDPKHNKLSPGLLLKAFTIKQAIEEGKKKYDFLRGGERYKFDLGGVERKLYKISF